MSNLHSNYIDFRSEHRLYLLDGCISELVGMIADTDYDEWDEDTVSEDPSPITWYKLIVNPEYMHDGGHYREGSLPFIFAHRGDVLKEYQLVNYLMNNIVYSVDSPICLLEDLKNFDLSAILTDSLRSISIRLCSVWSGYRVETSAGGKLMFISTPKDGSKGVVFTSDGHEKLYSYKELAKAFGQILYALREFFHDSTININRISIVENECTSDEKLVPAPKGYTKFLRLVNLGAEKERMYWEWLDTMYGSKHESKNND